MSFSKPASKAQRKSRQRAIAKNIGGRLLAQGRENVSAALAEADSKTRLEGMSWYSNAHSIASDMALKYELSVSQTAGVIAALSPQTGWKTNIALAGTACAHMKNGVPVTGHTGNACEKASRILYGEDPSAVLGGRKVRSFYYNILNPDSNGAVTIDRHMLNLVIGEIGTNPRILEKIGIYTFAAASIRGAARDALISGPQAQAIAWLWHRRKNNSVGHRTDPIIKITVPKLAGDDISQLQS